MSALPSYHFAVEAEDGAARAGRYETPHGIVQTPTFMSVATYGAVRGVDAADLAGLGAQILLANTYHLHERPGEETIAALGGLHGFTSWQGPWLTDSGGFQISSMGDRVTLDESGIEFSSPLDGRRRALTPERVVATKTSESSRRTSPPCKKTSPPRPSFVVPAVTSKLSNESSSRTDTSSARANADGAAPR